MIHHDWSPIVPWSRPPCYSIFNVRVDQAPGMMHPSSSSRWSFVLTGPILWHNSIEWDWTSCQQKIFDLFWQNYFRNSSLARFVCSLVCFLTSAGSQVLSHIITNVFSNVSTHAANCVQTFSTIVTSSESNSPLTNSYILNTSSCGNIHLQTVYLPTLIIETVENDHYQDRKRGTF